MSHARLAVGALLWSLGLPPAGSIREELDVSALTVTIAAPIRKEPQLSPAEGSIRKEPLEAPFLEETTPDPHPSAKSWTKAAVFVLDYDGCFDIVAMEGDGDSGFVNSVALTGRGSDQWFAEEWFKQTLKGIPIRKKLVDKFTDFVKDRVEDKDKVIVFLGSFRQDAKTDDDQALAQDNGSARTALEEWVRANGGVWELKKDLLGDYDYKISPTGGKIIVTTQRKTWEDGTAYADGTAWDSDRSLMPKVDPKSLPQQKYLKQAIVALHMDIASRMADEVEAYFFDDNWLYLDHIKKNYKSPSNVVLRVVWWDWMSYATGKPQGMATPPWWETPKQELQAWLCGQNP